MQYLYCLMLRFHKILVMLRFYEIVRTLIINQNLLFKVSKFVKTCEERLIDKNDHGI